MYESMQSRMVVMVAVGAAAAAAERRADDMDDRPSTTKPLVDGTTTRNDTSSNTLRLGMIACISIRIICRSLHCLHYPQPLPTRR